MTQKQEDDDRKSISLLTTDVAVMKNDLKSIKATQRETLSEIKNFTFTKQSDFDEFKAYAEKTYATNDKVKPVLNFFWAVLTAVGVSIIYALVKIATKQ